MQKHEAGNHNAYQSETRYQTAYNAFRDIDYNAGIEHAKNILSGKRCEPRGLCNGSRTWLN